MQIEKHRLVGVPFIPSPNIGKEISPKFLVLHFTADFRASSAINWFQNEASRVSAHIVLGRDGELTQMVPFNVKAWHVGASYWKGHSDLNSSSIGIEIVNYGGTPQARGERVLTSEGGSFPDEISHKDDWHYAAHPLEPGRMQYWQRYTEAQIIVLDELVPLLVETYNLREVVGHEEVATPRGRKTDPGPALPLDHYKSYAEHANAGSEGRFVVITNDLNVRGGPGVGYTIISKLNRGDAVKVLKTEGDWSLITYDNTRGWAHASFLMRA